jgi:hypothetical protein
MGLIDLRTDLKSLRYGNDQRGGGSSNQPYITTSIPEGYAPTSADFLLRNGYLNPVNSFQDVKRLSKFFTDTKTPNGLLFTIKQELLERQNPKLVNINRIYNPLGTLAQAGLNSLGFHVNKQGLNNSEPSYFNGGRYGYYYATRGFGVDPTFQFLPGEGYENRLTIAYTAKVEKKPLGSLNINPFGVTNLAGSGILLSYPGGPNAPLGLGITNIRIQNPTRTVDLPKDRTIFSLREGGSNIDNRNYLVYSGAPTINWVYGNNNYEFGINRGASDAYYSLDNVPTSYLIKLTGNQTGNVKDSILNRDTSVNKPHIQSDNTFNLNGELLKTDLNYLRPTGVDSSNVTWVYPSGSIVKNRDTSVRKPEDRPSNTFNLNSGKLKTDLDYLRPTDVNSSTVTWSYQPISPEKTDARQRLETKSGIDGGISATDAQSISKALLTRNGSSGKDAPKTIIPSKTILEHPNTFETGKYKGSSGLVNSSKLTEASDKYANEVGTRLVTSLNDNLLQNIPTIQSFSDAAVVSNVGTTLLESLNPYYKIKSIPDPQTPNEGGTVLPPPYPDIAAFNRETTYGTSVTSFYTDRSRLNNDSINSDYIQQQYVLQPSGNETIIDELKNKDLVRFFFEINNNDATTDTENFWLFFRAYLNEFGDDYKAEWDSYKYVGRAENFYKYTGFSRNLSLSFTVYAHSRAEMKPIYQKLNYLAGTTAPNYSGAGYMRGNFVNITVGNYLNSVPCIIESVNLKPSFEAGWDLNRDTNGNIIDGGIEVEQPSGETIIVEGADANVGQLPRMIDVSLNIIPIHSFTPRFQAPFINTPAINPQASI